MPEMLTADGKIIHPQGFKVNSIRLFTFTNEIIDISPMVSEIVLRESIFLPTMIMELTIKDAVNFFEMYSLSGQERIFISLEKSSIFAPDITQKIDLEFYISEYSAFVKSPTSATSQGYTMKGISPYAFNSKFIKISRAYSNSSTSEIVKIITKDLFYDRVRILGADSTSHRGIINIQEPMGAIEHLRRAAFDDQGAPFFCFQSLDGFFNVASLTGLFDDTNNPVYNQYVFLKGYNSNPNTPEEFQERAQRILESQSNLGMSKAFQATQGAYASNTITLDIKDKSYRQKVFNYMDSGKSRLRNNTGSGEERAVFSTEFGLGRDYSEPLNNLPEAHQEFLSTNSGAFAGEFNYNADMAENVEMLNSYMALMDTMTLNIRLHGDFMIQAGTRIELFYPRAIEASGYKQINPKKFKNVPKDEIQSGKYLVTSAIHRFDFSSNQGNEHFVSLEVKKDTVF
jgi:hypothetical protein